MANLTFFANLPKVKCAKICIFLLNGPNILCLHLIPNIAHDLWDPPCFIYLIYFDFYSLKIQIKSNKSINHIMCFRDDFCIEGRSYVLSNENQFVQDWFRLKKIWLKQIWKDIICHEIPNQIFIMIKIEYVFVDLTCCSTYTEAIQGMSGLEQ